MLEITDATAADLPFLERVFVITADWDPADARGEDHWRADPTFAQYVGGFPRESDRGLIARLDGEPVGASWWRFFPAEQPGYGFVSADIAELGIGVVDGYRGRGIGRALLTGLQDVSPGVLSLSVEDGNPAIELYRSCGFVAVGRFGEATTMLWRRDGSA